MTIMIAMNALHIAKILALSRGFKRRIDFWFWLFNWHRMLGELGLFVGTKPAKQSICLKKN